MLIEIAHMGFGDGEPSNNRGRNLAIGRVLVLPLPAKAYQHIIAMVWSREARGAGPPPRADACASPDTSREGSGPVAWHGETIAVCTVLSQAR